MTVFTRQQNIDILNHLLEHVIPLTENTEKYYTIKLFMDATGTDDIHEFFRLKDQEVMTTIFNHEPGTTNTVLQSLKLQYAKKVINLCIWLEYLNDLTVDGMEKDDYLILSNNDVTTFCVTELPGLAPTNISSGNFGYAPPPTTQVRKTDELANFYKSI